MATTNLPWVQGSESEFCPYSGDVGDQFSANLDSSGDDCNRRALVFSQTRRDESSQTR